MVSTNCPVNNVATRAVAQYVNARKLALNCCSLEKLSRDYEDYLILDPRRECFNNNLREIALGISRV